MNARENPLKKFESLLGRLFEEPFARLFPSRLEPVEIDRRLERAMEDKIQLLSEGRHLAPNIYDIYLSIEDHKQIKSNEATLIRDWQNNLVKFARRRGYTLRTVPIIRLHGETALHSGMVRIESAIVDSSNAEDHTQALSAAQLAELQAQAILAQHVSEAPSHNSLSAKFPASGPLLSPDPIPRARLTIQLPQGGQDIYKIEKPVVNIGRQLTNDIVVPEKRVSRYHAQIKYQPDGQFAIFDLGSANGITINNTQRSQHVLGNGDRFTIGGYDFYFERR